jgi:hypothetical protein
MGGQYRFLIAGLDITCWMLVRMSETGNVRRVLVCVCVTCRKSVSPVVVASVVMSIYCWLVHSNTVLLLGSDQGVEQLHVKMERHLLQGNLSLIDSKVDRSMKSIVKIGASCVR